MRYFLLLFFITNIYSQSFEKELLNGKKKESVIAIIYKFNFYNDNPNKSQTTTSVEIKKQINAVDDILKKNEYGLFISKNRSVYKKIDKIQSMDESNKFSIIANALNSGIYYSNSETKEKICQYEDGQKFNVIRSLDEYKWILTNESKIINGYKCYKATSHKEEFSELRKRNISLDAIVWYAPELPFPFGPSGFDGLPGLVLEGSRNGKSYFYATKIDFDYKEKIDFERPTTGKYVTPEEYEAIQTKMINERIQN